MAGDLQQERGFRVIGAGLPRTGTMSLMYALEILLNGKCLHGMKAHFHEKEWYDILDGNCSEEQLQSFLSSHGYAAALDAPFCFHYDLALKLFSNAKVILTVREPKSWVKSMMTTVSMISWKSYIPVYMFKSFFPSYVNIWANDESLKGWSKKMFISCKKNKRFLKMAVALRTGKGSKYFEEWEKEVESTVPQEKLLKFNVKDGWEPLCKFLDLPVPDVPFPQVNSADVISSYLQRNRRRAWLLLYECITIPMCVYGVYQLTR